MNRSRRVTTAQRIKYLFLLLMLVLSSNILTIQSALAESTQYFNEPFASSGSFTVPAGVTSVTVELWGGGGGGGGGGSSNKNGGGGGAGGQYARKAVTVTPGNSYSVIVGNGGSAASNTNGGAGGDSTFNGTAVVAKGGTGGQWYNNGGSGGVGSISGGVGDVIYAGGSGANGMATYGGGGGSGAGSTGTGNSGSTSNGGAAKADNGGAGGTGSTSNSGNGTAGSTYGGGGAGSTKNGTPGVGAAGYAYITWSTTVYTITYAAGSGGTLSGTLSQDISQGGSGTAVTANPNTGYHFTQWSDASTANPRTDTNVQADASLTASFAPNIYTLLYYAGVGGSLTGTATQYVNHGSNGTAVTAVPSTGYHFVNWSDGITTATRTDTNVTANKSVTANFAINTYTLNYAAGSGGTISGTASQVVNHGSNGTAVTAVPNTGYHFVNWSDGITTAARTDTNVTANKSVTANFAINTYTLNYAAGTGGTISGTASQVVNHGSNGTAVTAVPNANYAFVNWSDGITTAARTDTNVTANKSVTANFTPTYTLNYTAGSGGTLSGTTSQVVNQGASGSAVTAVPNTGYHFVNWSDGITTAARTDTNVTANKSVTANFAINTYTLNYAAGSGGTISGTASQVVNHGASGTTVTAVPNTGYHFVNWSDGITTAARTDTNVTANKSVTANFAINTYTLTYTAGAGGTRSGTSPQTVNHGASGTAVTAVPNTGYHFVNWSDGITTAARTDTNVTANKSVTANFAINTYTLTYTAGTGGTRSGTSPQTVNHGASGTTVTAVPNANYAFVNWSDGITTAARTDTNVTANKSVTANFTPTYTLNYTAGSGGTLSGTTSQVVNQGASGSAVTANPNTGYTFVNWSDGSTANPRTDTNVTANKSVTANFAINTFTLNYTAGSGGTISGTASQNVNYGGSGTAVTAVPNTGYHFVNWSDGITTASRTDTNVTANKSVTANFAINTYTLTYTAGTGGTRSGTSPQTVNHGANGTAVTAVPNTGYHFVNWSDGITTAARTDTNVTANKSVTANFAINTYTLLYNAGVGGSLTGTATQYISHGSNATQVTAVPSTGYTFSQWSDGVMSANRTDTNVMANKSVTANFTPNAYTIRYSAGPGGSIVGTATQIISFGGNGTAVTATPNPGFYFVKWSDGSGQNPRTDLNVSASKNISAEFDVIGSTKAKMTNSTARKITIGSMSRGLIVDLPLKIKYTKSTAVAGSELLTDKTPHANDAQNYGAVISSEGANFDGVNDYIKINKVLVSSPSALTISAWVKKESGGSTYECALHHGPDTSIGSTAYWLGIQSTDYLTATIGANTGAGWAAGQTNVLVTYGEWYHLAASWDGAVVRVYVNGEFNKQYNLASYVNSTAPTRIGASSDGANYQLKGSVANVRIYESALSATEIKSIYDKGLEGSPFILKGQN